MTRKSVAVTQQEALPPGKAVPKVQAKARIEDDLPAKAEKAKAKEEEKIEATHRNEEEAETIAQGQAHRRVDLLLQIKPLGYASSFSKEHAAKEVNALSAILLTVSSSITQRTDALWVATVTIHIERTQRHRRLTQRLKPKHRLRVEESRLPLEKVRKIKFISS